MLLIYGAYGYTGELVARRAVAQGVAVVLAGRSEQPLERISAELRAPHRTFGVDDADAIRAGLAGVRGVLNCAGPFSSTALPLARACLQEHVHYVDITGEIAVFESLAALDGEARAAGITLLPGAGFDVVPSDCLAAHTAARLPKAQHLTLAFTTSSKASRGTATTALQNAGGGGMVRRNGKLTRVPTSFRTITVDFGRGPQRVVSIPWGDVATAFYSTGIPNIETYVALPAPLRLAMYAAPLLAWKPLQTLMQRRIRKAPAGPSKEQRSGGWSRLFAEVRTPDGQTRRSRLVAPEAYELTSWTALELASRAARGELPVGFTTPSRACGPDFIMSFPGVVREDMH